MGTTGVGLAGEDVARNEAVIPAPIGYATIANVALDVGGAVAQTTELCVRLRDAAIRTFLKNSTTCK